MLFYWISPLLWQHLLNYYTIIVTLDAVHHLGFFFFNDFFHNAFWDCLICEHYLLWYLAIWSNQQYVVAYITFGTLKCCLGSPLARFWNRAYLFPPSMASAHSLHNTLQNPLLFSVSSTIYLSCHALKVLAMLSHCSICSQVIEQRQICPGPLS